MTQEARRQAYLDAMGIQAWVERQAPNNTITEAFNVCENTGSLEELFDISNKCIRCESSSTRQQVVFGEGLHQSNILIVGESPSEQDDKQGVPFSDKAGVLLSEILLAAGVNRAATYITNSVKCRPLNGEFNNKEFDACRDYLVRQIELVCPNVILVLGEKAAQSLLKTKQNLSKMRGEVQAVDDIQQPVIVTHHPLFLMQAPQAKSETWEDVRSLRNLLN